MYRCHLHCTVLLMLKKLLQGRLSLTVVKEFANPYLALFSCNKLIYSCKNEAHEANYCNHRHMLTLVKQ